MTSRLRRLAVVALFLCLTVTGCTDAARDGFTAGVEEGVSAAIAALAEAWINAAVGGAG